MHYSIRFTIYLLDLIFGFLEFFIGPVSTLKQGRFCIIMLRFDLYIMAYLAIFVVINYI